MFIINRKDKGILKASIKIFLSTSSLKLKKTVGVQHGCMENLPEKQNFLAVSAWRKGTHGPTDRHTDIGKLDRH